MTDQPSFCPCKVGETCYYGGNAEKVLCTGIAFSRDRFGELARITVDGASGTRTIIDRPETVVPVSFHSSWSLDGRWTGSFGVYFDHFAYVSPGANCEYQFRWPARVDITECHGTGAFSIGEETYTDLTNRRIPPVQCFILKPDNDFSMKGQWYVHPDDVDSLPLPLVESVNEQYPLEKQ